MKFSMLLYVLGKKLKKGSKKNEEMIKKIAEKNYTIQIKTADDKIGRYYTFDSGKVLSKRGLHGSPSVSLIWSDASTGFSVLASGSGKASMKALQDGKLKLDGDAALALHFTEITKHI